jgi:hypothetical protein
MKHSGLFFAALAWFAVAEKDSKECIRFTFASASPKWHLKRSREQRGRAIETGRLP